MLKLLSTLASIVVLAWLAPAFAQPAHPDLSGSWTLNTDQSDHPQQSAQGSDDDGRTRGGDGRGGGGGRGGGFGGGRGGFGGGRGGFAGGGGRGQRGGGNTDDRLRALEMNDEIRNPPQALTIAQKADTVSITGADNQTRVFRTNGKKDTHELQAVKIDTRTTWDGDRLVVEYDVGSGRKIRYTYSRSPNTGQLIVETQIDSGRKGAPRAPAIKRVYDKTAG